MSKPFKKWVSECGHVTLYWGDCLDVMPTMPENAIESVITDPPYGLKFMGKKWDHGVPGVPFWEAAKRVMKPGAMLLAFGGMRTQHRLVCAIEDAGLEIKNGVVWIYGSGFPKNLDISKQLDLQAGAVREVVGPRPGREAFVGLKKPIYKNCKNGWERPWMQDDAKCELALMQTAPASAAAQEWDGYGTAMKPATEIICCAMKSLDGTYAANALKHGVAGFNIDGGRIPCDWKAERGETWLRSGKDAKTMPMEWQGAQTHVGLTCADRVSDKGRWPANVIFDEAAAAELDAQSGVSKSSGVINRWTDGAKPFGGGAGHPYESVQGVCDSGGASRFFKIITDDPLDSGRFRYCAKPSRAERNAGLEGMEKKESRTHGDLGPCESNPKHRTAVSRENFHPTCKPIKLLRYLALLTKTPTGGAVLDPFMGSGSQGVAAIAEGRDFIGIEKELEYFKIAKRRIRHALKEAHAGFIPIYKKERDHE